MRWFSRFIFIGSAACAIARPADPMKVEVPPQPLQVAPPATEPLVPSAPIAVRSFQCRTGLVFHTGDVPLCGHVEPLTWDDAEARCVADGGHLLAFEREEDSKSARALLASPITQAGRAAWVGLEIADKKKRTWKWSDGDPLKQPAWSAGEPNNWDGNEQCAEWLFANGRWNDTRCNLEQPYLCEDKPGATFTCPTAATFIGGKKTCWVDKPANFGDAKKGCAKLGGTLAMLKAAEESDQLTKAMGQRFPVTELWVGLNELAAEGTWLWTTGAPIAFSNWKHEEPNGYRGNEHCTELFAHSWQWNDLDCSERLPFVCQSSSHQRL